MLAVALNSKRNGLLALLIANNFVEIKGAVGAALPFFPRIALDCFGLHLGAHGV